MFANDIPKKMGVSVDYGDFIIIRPKESYRLYSGVIVLKGENPVIIDVGTPADPGISRIKRAFKKHGINPDSIKYIFLTHSHQDHTFNLKRVQNLCRNAKTICDIKDYRYVRFPTKLSNSWGRALKLMGKDRIVRLIYQTFSVPSFMIFYRSVNIYPKVDYTIDSQIQNSHFDLNKCEKIKVGELDLTIIPTPGHSAGHFSILDSNKNLFLGDFLPFTPWINPISEALDDMVQSIKNICTLTEDQVKYAVRSHGDIRREYWEVTTWAEEKERFCVFLKTINDSIEKIPRFLKIRPMNIHELTSLLIPKYQRYSIWMNLLFIPPSITWVLSYCLKLEKEGKIKRVYKRNKIFWSL